MTGVGSTFSKLHHTKHSIHTIMVHIIFTFADGDSKRDFNSTFDAYVEVLNAYNQCEEYFLGARLATSKKPEYINILDAETYLEQVSPVKDYLEYAAVAGFDEEQIMEDIAEMFFMKVTELLPSWKKHMREYASEIDKYMRQNIF